MKNLTFLMALMLATSANAFSLDDHKSLAKTQALEAVTSDKSASEMLDEHKELATESINSSVEEATASATDSTSETTESVSETVETIKGLFN